MIFSNFLSNSPLRMELLNAIHKNARFSFKLVRFTNMAEAINPWNLIKSTRFNPDFVTAYPTFNYSFSFSQTLGLLVSPTIITCKGYSQK